MTATETLRDPSCFSRSSNQCVRPANIRSLAFESAPLTPFRSVPTLDDANPQVSNVYFANGRIVMILHEANKVICVPLDKNAAVTVSKMQVMGQNFELYTAPYAAIDMCDPLPDGEATLVYRNVVENGTADQFRMDPLTGKISPVTRVMEGDGFKEIKYFRHEGALCQAILDCGESFKISFTSKGLKYTTGISGKHFTNTDRVYIKHALESEGVLYIVAYVRNGSLDDHDLMLAHVFALDITNGKMLSKFTLDAVFCSGGFQGRFTACVRNGILFLVHNRTYGYMCREGVAPTAYRFDGRQGLVGYCALLPNNGLVHFESIVPFVGPDNNVMLLLDNTEIATYPWNYLKHDTKRHTYITHELNLLSVQDYHRIKFASGDKRKANEEDHGLPTGKLVAR
jgi:hypothetical protein